MTFNARHGSARTGVATTAETSESNVHLRRQLGIVRHWFWLLVASVLLGGGAAFLVSSTLPKTYEATATLIVGQSLSAVNPEYNDVLTSQRLSQTYAHVATTRPLLERVILRLQLSGTVDDLARRVTAEAPRDSTLIRVVASDGDATRAATIANAVAEELLAASPAIHGRQADVQTFIDEDLRSIQRQIEQAQAEVARLTELPSRSARQEQQVQTLEARLVSLRSTYATLLSFSSTSASNLLTIVDPAFPPTQPASPRVVLTTILAALLALLIAIGIAFFAEYLDDTVKSAEEVEATFGLPTLGSITRMKGGENRAPMYRLATLLYPRSAVAEAYRTLRTNVEFAQVDGPLRTVLVTSAMPGEGKTTTASNLAVACAQAGRRVLLIDADMRKPSVHVAFRLANTTGLSTLFRQEDARYDGLVQATEQDRLWVLTSGPLPPNPAELVGSQRFRAFLTVLANEFDLVVLDSPPLEAVTDAALLASMTDGTLLVIDAGRSRRAAVARAHAALLKSGARVLGAVVNRLSQRAQGSYYYDYHATDAAAHGPDGKRARATDATPQ